MASMIGGRRRANRARCKVRIQPKVATMPSAATEPRQLRRARVQKTFRTSPAMAGLKPDYGPRRMLSG
jgi:hypothetical protein